MYLGILGDGRHSGGRMRETTTSSTSKVLRYKRIKGYRKVTGESPGSSD